MLSVVVDIVFRCSEKIFACRDSTGESVVLIHVDIHVDSGTYFHSSEFCVWTASNTIGRSPPSTCTAAIAAPVPKERDAFVPLLLLCDILDPLTSLSIVGDRSDDVAEADETCNGISDSDFMCLPVRNTIF